jgi:catechol 2,3-dioxygenase-like lactoylglutathione lyase family enzyme
MYVPSTDQLVYELDVADMDRAVRFYEDLGFAVTRREPQFSELTWEGHKLFLAADAPLEEGIARGHLRIMVPDVDERYAQVQRLGARVLVPIRNTSYGLRDFIFCDSDGNRLRFGTYLLREARSLGQLEPE